MITKAPAKTTWQDIVTELTEGPASLVIGGGELGMVKVGAEAAPKAGRFIKAFGKMVGVPGKGNPVGRGKLAEYLKTLGKAGRPPVTEVRAFGEGGQIAPKATEAPNKFVEFMRKQAAQLVPGGG